MAIKLEDEYVNVTPADADYPGGSFKDASSGSGVDGTPLQKKWANDWLGFFSALLAAAGITPSGAPDTALVSQYLTAVQALITAAVSSAVSTHNAVTSPHGAVTTATANRLALRDAAGKLAGDILGAAAAAAASVFGTTFAAGKNGQTTYASAGVKAYSVTGDVHIGLEASGSTATSLKHVRGGSGIVVMAADGETLAPLTALTFAGGLFPANVGAAVGAAALDSVGGYALLFDTGVRATTPGQARAGSELRYASTLANTSDVGYGPYAPAGTWTCCGHTGIADGVDASTSTTIRTTLWKRTA